MSRLAGIGTLATNYTILLLGALNGVVLARYLGPADRGAVAAALLWPILLVGLTHQGLLQAIIYHASKGNVSRSSVFFVSLMNAVLLTCVVVPVGFALMPWLLANQESDTVRDARLYLAIVPMLMLTESNSAILQGEKQFGAVNLLKLTTPSGYLIGTLILYSSGGLNVRSVVLLQLALATLRLILSLQLVVDSGFKGKVSGIRTLLRDVWGYGLKAHLGSVSSITSASLDQAMVAAFLSPGALGLYVVSVSAAQILSAIAQSVRMLLLPSIASVETLAAAKSLFYRIFPLYWNVSLLSACALAPLLYLGVPMLYGDSFRGAIWIAEGLLVATIVLGAKEIWITGARAMGQPWLTSRSELVGMIVTITLLPLLLPTLNLWGAVLVSILAYSSTLYVVVRSLGRVLGDSGWKLFQPSPSLLISGAYMYLKPTSATLRGEK